MQVISLSPQEREGLDMPGLLAILARKMGYDPETALQFDCRELTIGRDLIDCMAEAYARMGIDTTRALGRAFSDAHALQIRISTHNLPDYSALVESGFITKQKPAQPMKAAG